MEYFSKKLGKKTRRQKEGKRPMVTVATLL
jgi:hypothetical protein